MRLTTILQRQRQRRTPSPRRWEWHRASPSPPPARHSQKWELRSRTPQPGPSPKPKRTAKPNALSPFRGLTLPKPCLSSSAGLCPLPLLQRGPKVISPYTKAQSSPFPSKPKGPLTAAKSNAAPELYWQGSLTSQHRKANRERETYVAGSGAGVAHVLKAAKRHREDLGKAALEKDKEFSCTGSFGGELLQRMYSFLIPGAGQLGDCML